MKLIRFGKAGEEKPGIVIDDVYYDVSDFGEDYDENFFGTWWTKSIRKISKRK
jgi:hypothetical protein